MNRIAVLMTCHNRKDKTLRCLESLRDEVEKVGEGGQWNLDIFLVDDGCTDGTGEKVASRKFLVSSGGNVHLIQGSGSDFWARGMSRAWGAAVSSEKVSSFKYDGFLWLNDDVELNRDFSELLRLCVENYPGDVLVGACCNETGEVSYGGTDEQDRLMVPDGTCQVVKGWFTGNFVLIPREVYEKIGMIDGAYSHARADYDYAERLKRAGVLVRLLSRYVGCCANNWSEKMRGKSLFARLAMLWRPGYYNLHDLWRIRHRYHGIGAAFISCLHMVLIMFRRVK